MQAALQVLAGECSGERLAKRGVALTEGRDAPLPYEGTLEELAETMNSDLAAWADDWL